MRRRARRSSAARSRSRSARSPRTPGLEGSVVVDKIQGLKPGEGLNADTGEYGDLIKAGVIDPTMVTRSALQNAASIAKNILTTEAIVAEPPEKDGGGMPRRYARHGRDDVTRLPGECSEEARRNAPASLLRASAAPSTSPIAAARPRAPRRRRCRARRPSAPPSARPPPRSRMRRRRQTRAARSGRRTNRSGTWTSGRSPAGGPRDQPRDLARR